SDFDRRGWPEPMKDHNVVFALKTDPENGMMHDRPAAKMLWSKLLTKGEGKKAICLVTGERGPIARLHPAIRRVRGALSSGASMVSFNLDAFTSYGHKQGNNAPVSEAAAFAYTAALNHFLSPNSGHHVQIGDTAMVFWASAVDQEVAAEAENLFIGLLKGAV